MKSTIATRAEFNHRATPGADLVSAIDLRFRTLLPADEWAKLPAAIQRRFSKRLANGATSVYVGEVREMYVSRLGWLLTQALRLIGGPLPTTLATNVPSVVTVTEDMATGGQIWTRLYVRRNGFPQVIHSSKRFAGFTGLEEYVGFGIGMALTISVVNAALVFRSKTYFLQIGKRRIPLPFWLTPGAIVVSHEELGGGRFLFSLEVIHPKFGLLVRQSAAFRESHP
jgi:Domain of unknown function (DUF4166)